MHVYRVRGAEKMDDESRYEYKCYGKGNDDFIRVNETNDEQRKTILQYMTITYKSIPPNNQAKYNKKTRHDACCNFRFYNIYIGS